jgi:hypothetical protein
LTAMHPRLGPMDTVALSLTACLPPHYD